MLELENVVFRYSRRAEPVLRGVSLTLNDGEIGILLGKNGAGKTTLLSCLIGTAKPQRGKIKLQKNCRLAMLPQRPQALFTQDDVLSDLLEVGTETDARAWAEKLELTGLLDRHPFDLSGGELQRAALCKLLLRNADVLLLDEPTNHLDLVYQKQIFSLVREWLSKGGRAVVSVVHDLSLARMYGSRGVLLDHGKIAAAGEAADVFAPETLNAVYRMDVADWMRTMLSQWEK